jgi:HNH endonuclease
VTISILLSDGTEALVDVEFAHLVRYNWTAVKRGKRTYVARRGEDGVPIYLHHVILPDCPPGLVRDHKNGDGRDNRKDNLRLVTRLVNQRNHDRPSGVSRKRDKWRAYIWEQGRQKSLGVYPTEAAAREARLSYEKKAWGIQPQREHLHAR